jgi:hypothetical protein
MTLGWINKVMALGVCLALALPADADVPANLQAAILAKMLAYDRGLKARAGDSVGIGIVYKEGDEASLRAKGELLRAFEAVGSRAIQGLPVRTAEHAYRDAEQLAQWLDAKGIDLAYVTSGLAKERAAIRKACVGKKTLTSGVDRADVEAGLSVAVVTKGTAPRILVNIAAAHEVGADLDPKLLELSDVIR